MLRRASRGGAVAQGFPSSAGLGRSMLRFRFLAGMLRAKARPWFSRQTPLAFAGSNLETWQRSPVADTTALFPGVCGGSSRTPPSPRCRCRGRDRKLERDSDSQGTVATTAASVYFQNVKNSGGIHTSHTAAHPPGSQWTLRAEMLKGRGGGGVG